MAATATEGDPLSGRRFRLYKINGAERVFICIGVTMSFTRTAEYDDATMPRCDVPTAAPDRKSQLKMRGWGLSFSGKADANRVAVMEADYESDDPHKYAIVMDPPTAVGGKREYVGDIFYESFELAKQDNGMATFSAQCRGEGKYTTTVLT